MKNIIFTILMIISMIVSTFFLIKYNVPFLTCAIIILPPVFVAYIDGYFNK